MKDDKGREHNQNEPQHIIPLHQFTHVQNLEGHKHAEGQHLLKRFQFSDAKIPLTMPVSGNHEAVLEKRKAPAYENYLPGRSKRKLQMPVPGEGHKNIRAQQKTYGNNRNRHMRQHCFLP
jgi:hypothetical protein